ncbi:MAG: hypothetical protein WKF86_07775 [Acidimicrobiales bacterium]
MSAASAAKLHEAAVAARAKAAEESAKADQALALAAAADERLAEARAERQDRFDRAVIELYDPVDLERAEQDARAAFEAALLADPVTAAWVRWRLARRHRQQAAQLEEQLRGGLGLPAVRRPSIGEGEADVVRAQETIVHRHLSDATATILADFYEARRLAVEEAG